MQINVFGNAAEAVRAVALRVKESLRERPDLVLGLPAGRTPIDAYAELRRMYSDGEVDFSRATAFTIDEFVGIERSHPASFHRFVSDQLLAHVNIQAARTHSLIGTAIDLDAECARYDAAIAEAGGIGLQLLGIGGNGHIGFNEPADHLVSGTHRVVLSERTRHDNAALFGGDDTQVPREAVTMGIGTMLQADTIVLIALGLGKAPAIERTVRGAITTQLPASLLQTHRRVELYLDREAASGL